jgi:hypothetical protein
VFFQTMRDGGLGVAKVVIAVDPHKRLNAEARRQEAAEQRVS